MLAPGAPVLISGLRGVLGTSLDVSGLRRDLHAGAFGGAVTNPAEVLATLVASLHDKAGRVPVAGFYDQVRPMTEKERLHLARAGPPDSAMLAPAGAALGRGEPGFSAFERVTRLPAVVLTDLRTSGEGRTVIPAWAAPDLNVRLAAGQEPGKIAEVLRRHLQERLPPGMRGRLLIRSSCPPYTLDQRAPLLRAVPVQPAGTFSAVSPRCCRQGAPSRSSAPSRRPAASTSHYWGSACRMMQFMRRTNASTYRICSANGNLYRTLQASGQ